MNRFECLICSRCEDQCRGGEGLVPCVLNCSHMFCLSCIVTAITQLKALKSNGLADPIEDADKCPLCRQGISIIIPLSQMVTQDSALDTIKYFNNVIKGDLSRYEDIVEILRQHKSAICLEINELAHTAVNGSLTPEIKRQRLIDHITKHKLFLSLEFQSLFGSEV